MSDSLSNSVQPHCRLQFGLRSLFILVTVASVCLGYSMHWIQQRHRLLNSQAIVQLKMIDLRPNYVTLVRQALWLVGEQPVMALVIHSPELSHAEARWAFPEANVYPLPSSDP